MTLFTTREGSRRRPEDYIHNVVITIATIIFSQGVSSTVNVIFPQDSTTKVLIIWTLFTGCVAVSAIVLYGIPKARSLIIRLVRYVHRARPGAHGEQEEPGVQKYKRAHATFGQFSNSAVVDVSTDGGGGAYQYHHQQQQKQHRQQENGHYHDDHDDHGSPA
jgi:hypothetical protein